MPDLHQIITVNRAGETVGCPWARTGHPGAPKASRTRALTGGSGGQPGVEFWPLDLSHLPLTRAPLLLQACAGCSGVTLEAHATDQPHPGPRFRPAQLGVAFRKVGPGLTVARRRVLHAPDALRAQTGWASGASPADSMKTAMLTDPTHRQGNSPRQDLRTRRHFGLADRLRYCRPAAKATAAVARRMADLDGQRLPDALPLAQFRPETIASARESRKSLPRSLALARVQTARRRPFFTGPRS